MKEIMAEETQAPFSVALVVARFNSDITTPLYEGAVARLKELGVSDENITLVFVPGAVEIPITVQRLAKTAQYQAIITLGAVIYGETKHFDYVCQHVTYGCQRVALTQDVPVIFGVLTTQNRALAEARAGGSHSHAGRECADTAVEMVSILNQI